MKSYTAQTLHRMPMEVGNKFRFDTGVWQVMDAHDDKHACEKCDFHKSTACRCVACYNDDMTTNVYFKCIG